jgi:hypothetical protein
MKFLLDSAVLESSSLHAQEGFISEQSGSTSVEKDPTGKVSTQPGAKLDAGKVDVYRGALAYFPKALEAVARVSEAGARKYSWKGWMSVPDGVRRYTAALCRHLIKEEDELIDPDTGCLHAAQTAWNSLARLELMIRETETKSRL